ncbi:hypothetical protein DSO57_1035920 [Entomophthora muscae]|uniref:Uncharacterized protein n=1 Tax=Entomophthora muscae TaxID=34485 RepID=A0ACC2TA63_9FUNG|nr:hypothetical protein DSO57_1035920 [Entomophthora muscae]
MYLTVVAQEKFLQRKKNQQMALPTSQRRYKEGQDIPIGYTVFKNICVPTKQYNYLSTQGVLNTPLVQDVVNATIHHVLILPLLGYFEDKSLFFAFALQNEAGSGLGNTIVQFPDPVQLTCPTHACGD